MSFSVMQNAYEILLYIHGRNAPNQQRERLYMWESFQTALDRCVGHPELTSTPLVERPI